MWLQEITDQPKYKNINKMAKVNSIKQNIIKINKNNQLEYIEIYQIQNKL